MKIRVDNLSKGSEPIYSCDSETLTYKAGRMVKPKGARCHVQLLNINDKSLISIASNI